MTGTRVAAGAADTASRPSAAVAVAAQAE